MDRKGGIPRSVNFPSHANLVGGGVLQKEDPNHRDGVGDPCLKVAPGKERGQNPKRSDEVKKKIKTQGKGEQNQNKLKPGCGQMEQRLQRPEPKPWQKEGKKLKGGGKRPYPSILKEK